MDKLVMIVEAKRPMRTKGKITGKLCNFTTVNMKVQVPEGERAITWVKLLLSFVTIIENTLNFIIFGKSW